MRFRSGSTEARQRPTARVLNDLAGVEQAERVERRLDRAHDVQRIAADLLLECLAARRSHAVFGGDGPAEGDRRSVEIHPGRLSQLLGPWVVVGKDEVRVEVAVAGVAEGRAADPVLAGDGIDRDQ